jgi:hypothetical protein
LILVEYSGDIFCIEWQFNSSRATTIGPFSSASANPSS